MLCQFQQETRHGEDFRFSLEELVVGGVGDHRGIAILTNTYLLRGQRRSGEVLGEGFTDFRGVGR